MQISILNSGDKAFQPNQVNVTRIPTFKSVKQLGQAITEKSWSPIIFDKNYRHGDNFQLSNVAAFDIDNDKDKLSLTEAIEFFKDFKHIIATSRSHNVLKNGTIEDRYRVVLFFDQTVTNPVTYSTIMRWHSREWPFVDKKCVDIARFFFPCQEIVSINEDGIELTTDLSMYPEQEQSVTKSEQTIAPIANRGQLTRPTLTFLLEGAKPGEWHSTFFKAISNMKECGYSELEIREKLEIMCSNIGSPGLDEHDERNLYSIMNRPISKESALFYESWNKLNKIETPAEPTESLIISPSEAFGEFNDYITDTRKAVGDPTGLPGLDRLLGGGFRPSELTVLLANAKSGKNTLYHYLIWQLLKLNVKQGYVSREISPSTEVLPNLLSLEFDHNVWTIKKDQELMSQYRTTLGEWKDLMFAKGYGYFPVDELKRWIMTCYEKGVRLFFIDHLHYLLEEPEEYKTLSKLIRQIKSWTKELEIHINLIVQPSKPQGMERGLSLNSLRGGASIGQALDNLLILERYPQAEEKHISRLKLEVGRHKLARPDEIFLKYDPVSCSFSEVEVDNKEDRNSAGEPNRDPYLPDRSVTAQNYQRKN